MNYCTGNRINSMFPFFLAVLSCLYGDKRYTSEGKLTYSRLGSHEKIHSAKASMLRQLNYVTRAAMCMCTIFLSTAIPY